MGAGAAAGLSASISKASPDDLREIINSLPSEEREKLLTAMKGATLPLGHCHVYGTDHSTQGGGVTDDVVFPTLEGDWPLGKCRKALESWEGPPPEKGFAFLVEVGMMNPGHMGHVQVLQMCKTRLDEAGFGVLGAWLSPAENSEVRRKAKKSGTFALSTEMRLAISRCLVAKDPIIDVGIWESTYTGAHWKSGGRIALALQEYLEEQPEADRFKKLRDGNLPKVQVFYACGTDHCDRCDLWSGIEAGTWSEDYSVWTPGVHWEQFPTGLGVCVVPREQDKVQPERHDRLVYVAKACPGVMTDFSSTLLREALENSDFGFLCEAISETAGQFLCRPSKTQRDRLKVDFERLQLRQSLLEVFQTFDTSKSGNINEKEFTRVLLDDRKDWPEDRITELFKTADANNDGVINLSEFISWCWGERVGREIMKSKSQQLLASPREEQLDIAKQRSDEKAEVLGALIRIKSSSTQASIAKADIADLPTQEELVAQIYAMELTNETGSGTGHGL